LANTFSTSQIIDEVKKVKLPFHRGFSDSDRVTKKMDKVEIRGCLKSFGEYNSLLHRQSPSTWANVFEPAKAGFVCVAAITNIAESE
jgi:hypothetical protein